MSTHFLKSIFQKISVLQQILLLVVSGTFLNPYFATFNTKTTLPVNPIQKAYLQVVEIQSIPTFIEITMDYASVSMAAAVLIAVSLSNLKSNIFFQFENFEKLSTDILKNTTCALAFSVISSVSMLFYVDDLTGLAVIWVSLNVSLYVLMLRDSAFTAEATLKYFTLGAAATGLLFFGIFLHFVEYGSVDYADINFLLSRSLHSQPQLSFTQSIAFSCVFVAFLFKLGVYPFHFYLADIYEGVRYETLALITLPVKFAVYFAMLDFVGSYGYSSSMFHQVFTWLGLCSLIVGSYGAFSQQKLRRFWAYSYLGSMGFVFLGFQKTTLSLSTEVGTDYFVVYLFTWFTIMLLFLLVSIVKRFDYPHFKRMEIRYISQLHLMHTQPFSVRCLFHITFMSLAGVPPTLGFFAKLFVLAGCMENSFSYLALLVVLCFLPLNTYNYLRLIKAMTFHIKDYSVVSSNETLVAERFHLWAICDHCVFIIAFLPFILYMCPETDFISVYSELGNHRGFYN